MLQALCEEEQGISAVWEPCAVSVSGSLSQWDCGVPGEASMADAGRAEGGLCGLQPVGLVPGQPQQGRAEEAGWEGIGAQVGLQACTVVLLLSTTMRCPFPCRMAK